MNKEIDVLGLESNKEKMSDNLTRKAKLLQDKVLDCSREEQLKFFKNVVKQHTELEVYREEITSLKNGGVSL